MVTLPSFSRPRWIGSIIALPSQGPPYETMGAPLAPSRITVASRSSLTVRASASRCCGESHALAKTSPARLCARAASRFHPVAPPPAAPMTKATASPVKKIVAPNHRNMRRWGGRG